MKKLVLLIIIVAVAIFISPKIEQPGNLNINRIKTDASQSFPSNERIARAWFVEMVEAIN